MPAPFRNKVIKRDPGYRDGEHPLFTVNSVVYSGQGAVVPNAG